MTNEEGKYSFSKVPYGVYKLYIRSFDEKKKMTIEHDVLDVFINHQSYHSQISLDVSKFTISGIVVDSDNNPINGIDISLDGQTITKSDAQGVYHL